MRTASSDVEVPRIAELQSRKVGLLLLAFALVLAATLRFALADYSLWFDEYASLFFAHQPFTRLWSDWMLRETNPPLYYSILRGWMLLIGPMDRVALRVPTIVASLGLIVATYVGLARVYGERAAATAGIALAVSAQQIAYAHQVRGYSLLALALGVSFFGLVRIVDANQRNQDQPAGAWIAYVAGAVFANYLHTTGFLWLPISTLCLIVTDRRFLPFVAGLFNADYRPL